jgi:hypothetical protein
LGARIAIAANRSFRAHVRTGALGATAQGGSKWHASTVKAVLEGQAARTLMEAVASA